MKVKVYWNLKAKCFSIQHKGRVIAYRERLSLSDAEFKVSQAGRKRVIQNKRKNVHAYVTGIWVDSNGEFSRSCQQPVTYNPYLYSQFMRVTDGKLSPIVNASKVCCVKLHGKGKLFV